MNWTLFLFWLASAVRAGMRQCKYAARKEWEGDREREETKTRSKNVLNINCEQTLCNNDQRFIYVWCLTVGVALVVVLIAGISFLFQCITWRFDSFSGSFMMHKHHSSSSCSPWECCRIIATKEIWWWWWSSRGQRRRKEKIKRYGIQSIYWPCPLMGTLPGKSFRWGALTALHCITWNRAEPNMKSENTIKWNVGIVRRTLIEFQIKKFQCFSFRFYFWLCR